MIERQLGGVFPLGKNVMRVVDFRTPGVVFPIPGVLLVL